MRQKKSFQIDHLKYDIWKKSIKLISWIVNHNDYCLQWRWIIMMNQGKNKQATRFGKSCQRHSTKMLTNWVSRIQLIFLFICLFLLLMKKNEIPRIQIDLDSTEIFFNLSLKFFAVVLVFLLLLLQARFIREIDWKKIMSVRMRDRKNKQ